MQVSWRNFEPLNLVGVLSIDRDNDEVKLVFEDAFITTQPLSTSFFKQVPPAKRGFLMVGSGVQRHSDGKFGTVSGLGENDMTYKIKFEDGACDLVHKRQLNKTTEPLIDFQTMSSTNTEKSFVLARDEESSSVKFVKGDKVRIKNTPMVVKRTPERIGSTGSKFFSTF